MYLKLPNKIIDSLRRMLPAFIVATIVTFTVGIYYAILNSPPDYLQGDSMRIMYVHVPAAWLALSSYSFLALSCIAWFIFRNPIFNLFAKSIAPIGATFTLIALVTGSIWGKPTWGTWWAWDARLTSMLILFFLYIAYIMTWQTITNKDLAAKISAALGIIGFINIPIIKFSVDWWNTLHQPATISKLSAPSIHISMLTPLMLMTFAYVLFLITLFLIRYKIEILDQKILRVSNQ
jgi:heme exporter protein C